MAATAKKIADRFLGAALKNPNDRPEIYRKAAYTFMGLAQDPKNARSSGQLAQIGLQFADAAHNERPPVMDDFTDLLRETAVAYNEVGDDPMDLIARRREIHDERTPQLPGQVLITPETFTKDATLGRSAVIKFAPSPFEITQGIQQSQTVAFWQGVKKEAQAMTVDVSLGFLPTSERGAAELGISVRPFAEVEYGSDGNRTKILVDVGLGTRLTVVGNYVSVVVGMDPPKAGSASKQITAGASLGAFAAPSQAPLIRTIYQDPIAKGADSKLLAIPLKAVALLPLQTDAGLNDTSVLSFFDYGTDLITKVFFKQTSSYSMVPIPLYGDVAFVQIHNDAANVQAQAAYRLPFQLAM